MAIIHSVLLPPQEVPLSQAIRLFVDKELVPPVLLLRLSLQLDTAILVPQALALAPTGRYCMVDTELHLLTSSAEIRSSASDVCGFHLFRLVIGNLPKSWCCRCSQRGSRVESQQHTENNRISLLMEFSGPRLAAETRNGSNGHVHLSTLITL